MSNYSTNVVIAFRRGYRVLDSGVVVNRNNRVIAVSTKINTSTSYNYFTIRVGEKTREKVFVHRLAGYQKFGDRMFDECMQIRHLNNDSFDNRLDNLHIGTNKDNQLDRPKDDLMKYAINASQHTRKVSDDVVMQIRHDRELGMTYKQLMEKYNISSKGTMYGLLNREYVTKK